MRRTRMIVLGFTATMLMVTSVSLAASWKEYRGSGGWGMGSQYQRMFNPATVETVSGNVESVETIMPLKGMHSGIHLALKTDKGSLDVHLGPEWYIERLDTKIQKGDRIEVKGSRVTLAGKTAIIASEVKKGDNVLVLRDDNGVPAWAGWRR
ncbi:MAG: DNA-binding protein [Betaproteobacteria bacterium]